MKKLILFLGGALFIGTIAFALDWKPVAEMRLSRNLEIYCFLSGLNLTQVTSLNVSKSRNILQQESRSSFVKQKESCLLIVAENVPSEPSPSKGNPDNRGGSTGSR